MIGVTDDDNTTSELMLGSGVLEINEEEALGLGS